MKDTELILADRGRRRGEVMKSPDSSHDIVGRAKDRIVQESKSALAGLIHATPGERQRITRLSQTALSQLEAIEASSGLIAVPSVSEAEAGFRPRSEGGVELFDSISRQQRERLAKPIDVDPLEKHALTAKELLRRAEERFEALDLSHDPDVQDLFHTFLRKKLQHELSAMATMGAQEMRHYTTFLLGILPDRTPSSSSGTSSTEALDMKATLRRTLLALQTRIRKEFPPEQLFGTVNYAEAYAKYLAMLTEQNVIGRYGGYHDVLRFEMQRAIGQLRESEKKHTQAKVEAPTTTHPPENKVEQPQKWIDQQREAAYAKLISQFRVTIQSGGEAAIREWFVNMFTPGMPDGTDPLKVEDFAGLYAVPFSSDSASAVAGRELERLVLVFTDIGEYQAFARRIFGEEGNSSRGMNISGECFEKGSVYHETGLILSTGNSDFIAHEIRHSIDPHVGKREGIHKMLDEAFAYYYECFVKPETQPPDERAWKHLARSIGGGIYMRQYFGDEPNKPSEEELLRTAEKLAAAIQKISLRLGHLETQRVLVQQKTIDDVLALAGMKEDAGAMKRITM